jgi:hypothetical protein
MHSVLPDFSALRKRLQYSTVLKQIQPFSRLCSAGFRQRTNADDDVHEAGVERLIKILSREIVSSMTQLTLNPRGGSLPRIRA